MSNNFISQTAKDYDLEYYIVKSIYDKYGDNAKVFYERLEEEINPGGARKGASNLNE